MLTLIKSFAERYYTDSLMFQSAEKGIVNKVHLKIYLNNLAYIFQSSIQLIDYAIPRAKTLKLNEYILFLQQKRREEIGHDKWPEDDLNHLAGTKNSPSFDESLITKENRAYIEYSYRLIDIDPRYLLGYMFFAEAITVEAAPVLINNLLTKCHLKKEFFTSVTKHQEADVGHAEEGILAIKYYLNNDQYQLLLKDHLIQYSYLLQSTLDSFIIKGDEINHEKHTGVLSKSMASTIGMEKY